MTHVADDFRRLWMELWNSRHVHPAPDCAALLALHLQPGRHYHNAHHIVECLRQIDAWKNATDDTPGPAVQFALFFHDAIYDPQRNDNEAHSAALARETLTPLMDDPTVDAVVRLIRATDHKLPPAAPDEALIVDADLSILGQPPAVFDAYDIAIRAEYAWVPDAQYRTGRAGVLRRFLDRPHIFTTPWFHGQYEAPARVNLLRALSALEHPDHHGR